jgi:PKD repeat protein
MNIIYKLDGNDLKTYGVYISDSAGLLSKPKLKNPLNHNWETYHGEVVDLSKRYYESRDITLNCFIKASSSAEFITKCNTFLALFDQSGTRRLSVTVDSSEPILYEVYLNDGIEISKTWGHSKMIGTFSLKLKEPEPIKKVLKYTRTSAADKTVSITFSSSKLLNIYWGDGSHTFDVSGTNQTITHDYSTNGTFYIVVTGNIDEITSLTTTGTLVWNKL